MRIEIPAEVGTELIGRGLVGSAASPDRSPGDVADLAVSVVGVVGPTMVVTVAEETVKAALLEACRLLGAWRRRGEERFALEVRRGNGRLAVKVEVSADSPEEAARELVAAVDRVLVERSGQE